MSLDQYNSLMSSILNQQCTFIKLKVELEERNKRKCWSYEKFGYLACNCRNKNKQEKGKPISKNKFEVLLSRVMRCRIKNKVRIRRIETVKEVKYFRY